MEATTEPSLKALANLPPQDRELILAAQRRLIQYRVVAKLPVDERSVTNLIVLEQQLAAEAKAGRV